MAYNPKTSATEFKILMYYNKRVRIFHKKSLWECTTYEPETSLTTIKEFIETLRDMLENAV